MRAPKTIPIGLVPDMAMESDMEPGIGVARWDTMVDHTARWDSAGTVVMEALVQYVRRRVSREPGVRLRLTRLRNSGRSIEPASKPPDQS